jgi:redox-sensing transcriptional repressor
LPELKRLVLERLMRYSRFLAELTASGPVETVTSSQIAEALEIDPTQVRKDLGAIGLQGMGRIGYEACEVCRAIRNTLGFDQEYEAVLIGTGHLGSAVLAYSGFAHYGLRIVAAFDNDDQRIGRKIAGIAVKATKELTAFIKRRKIGLAILTTPAEVSQKLADRVAAAGVKAIWNFSPARLTAPDGIFVRNEHISMGLSQIAYHLKQRQEDESGDPDETDVACRASS